MASDEEIFTFLKGVLLNFLDVEEDSITTDAQIADLKMESLDFVELQVELEKNYKVKVRPAVFASGEVKTMGDFVSHIQRLLLEHNAAHA